MPTLELIVDDEGITRHILDEANAALYAPFGDVVSIYRNSHVESTGSLSDAAKAVLIRMGHYLQDLTTSWWADMTPVCAETVLGPFATHAEAIAAEVEWLRLNNLPELRKI